MTYRVIVSNPQFSPALGLKINEAFTEAAEALGLGSLPTETVTIRYSGDDCYYEDGQPLLQGTDPASSGSTGNRSVFVIDFPDDRVDVVEALVADIARRCAGTSGSQHIRAISGLAYEAE